VSHNQSEQGTTVDHILVKQFSSILDLVL
jgi:hypothetical protein